MLKGVAKCAGANGTTFRGQEADNYSIYNPILQDNSLLNYEPRSGVSESVRVSKSGGDYNFVKRCKMVVPQCLACSDFPEASIFGLKNT